uniref:Uncharacterized protein n=1 Tax=Physcomitrium patens TaxID=3218 RepID=A0A2K1L2E2_PHYPA|nr:hypothetical protein PHYPA_002991 [Physcomitrium patens]
MQHLGSVRFIVTKHLLITSKAKTPRRHVSSAIDANSSDHYNASDADMNLGSGIGVGTHQFGLEKDTIVGEHQYDKIKSVIINKYLEYSNAHFAKNVSWIHIRGSSSE